MNQNIKIGIAQINLVVGNLENNANKILEYIQLARDQALDLLVFPELTITGYPPEDLLLRQDFLQAVEDKIALIVEASEGIAIIFGYPERVANSLYNACCFAQNGKILSTYYKQLLPNYSVFDEKRYFKSGSEAKVVRFKGIMIGLTICEDIWFPGPCRQALQHGAQLIISINASPFCYDKDLQRKMVLKDRALENNLPIIYAHNVGAQDELVFDGGSMVVNGNGEVVAQAAYFKEQLLTFECVIDENYTATIVPQELPPTYSEEALVYQAIVLGVREYVRKSGASGVLIGLSGGIDSALTLAIAVDALGRDAVETATMPSRYTKPSSLQDALEQAKRFGVVCHNLPIEQSFIAFLNLLDPIFSSRFGSRDITEQNLQARCRGVIMMALSNYTGKLLLTTGNKSEMAVGYATLYGDMDGGFAPLKDVFKTLVYRLCQYRNSLGTTPVILPEILAKAPSAELAVDQTDQDSLPPYEILDGILQRYVVEDQGIDEIIQEGFDPEVVKNIVNLVDKNEFKRRQAAPGVRISRKAFGRDRRLPIISGYQPYKNI